MDIRCSYIDYNFCIYCIILDTIPTTPPSSRRGSLCSETCGKLLDSHFGICNKGLLLPFNDLGQHNMRQLQDLMWRDLYIIEELK